MVKLEKIAYTRNMDLATEEYLNRVDQCPCGDSAIHLIKGSDSSLLQERRKQLLVYLKGSKKNKMSLNRQTFLNTLTKSGAFVKVTWLKTYHLSMPFNLSVALRRTAATHYVKGRNQKTCRDGTIKVQ